MNTLLGELATLNDVQFTRYRVAFKFRKLQRAFLLDHVDIPTLQEVLHSTGVHALLREDVVPLSQLNTALSELYATIRTQYPVISFTQLKLAQECCFNWLQLAYKCSTGQTVAAGTLKLTLCLFSGSKPSDKARYMFSLLANANGAVEREGIRYFCHVTDKLARCFQEQLYSSYKSLDDIFKECLVHVRSAEDIADEELDGGIKRQLLSQFEMTKLFTVTPEPRFLSWLYLWQKLPTMERVVHHVRCAICSRKPILSFRYQCTQCPNFNMCQMCFLKGRSTSKHSLAHKAVEFSNGGKGAKSWHHRLLGMQSKTNQDGRVVDEPREGFVNLPNSSPPSSFEEADSALTTIMTEIRTSPKSSSPSHSQLPKTYKPAVIRIGSGDTGKGKRASYTITSPKKDAHHTIQSSPAHRVSYTSSNSSPDSVSSYGVGKFSFEHNSPLSSVSSDHKTSSLGSLSGGAPPTAAREKVPVAVVPRRRIRVSASDSAIIERDDSQMRELSEINKRLSMEVDQLLSELPPPPPSALSAGNLAGSLHQLQEEEEALQTQVSQLSNKRTKLAHELSDLISQVQHMHYGFVNLSNGVRTPSTSSLNGSEAVAPMHTRAESAPIQNGLPVTRYQPGSRRVLTPPLRATDLLDPLVEFTPGQLDPTNHRISVAW